MDIKNKKGVVVRKTITVKRGDDLFDKSGFRDLYDGYIINEIYCEVGNEFVSFISNEDILRLGKVLGDIDDIAINEQQIKKQSKSISIRN